MSKFSILKSVFISGIEKVIFGVSTDDSIPILKTLNIRVAEGMMYICTNNNRLMVLNQLTPQDSEGAFNHCITCKFLLEFLKRSDGEVVTIEEITISSCRVLCGTNEIEFQTFDPKSFPIFNVKEENIQSLMIEADVFAKGIKNVLSCVVPSETRPILANVHVDLLNTDLHDDNGGIVKELSFVGIDGFRASVHTEVIRGLPDETIFSINIPLDSAKIICSLFSKDNGSSKLVIGRKYLTIVHDTTILYCQLFEGIYMDYKKLFPTSFKCQVPLKKSDLASGVSVVELMMTEKLLPLKLSVKEEEMVISTSSDISKFTKTVKIDKDGVEVDAAYNPAYLSAALKVLDGEHCIIRFTDQEYPCLTLQAKDNEKVTILIMPIKA